MRCLVSFVVLLAAVFAAGCSHTQQYYFVSADTAAAWRRYPSDAARHVIEVERNRTVRVYLHATAVRNEEDGKADQAVSLVMRINNRSDVPIELFPGESVLLDDEGRRYERPSVRASPTDGEGGAFRGLIAAGAHIELAVEFEVPAQAHVGQMGSLRYEWSYQLGGERKTVVTKFIRGERGGDEVEGGYGEDGVFFWKVSRRGIHVPADAH